MLIGTGIAYKCLRACKDDPVMAEYHAVVLMPWDANSFNTVLL